MVKPIWYRTKKKKKRKQMIKTSVSGVEEFVAFIKTVPRGIKIAAMREIATYIIGNDARGLKHEPAYKHVSRKSAYGKTFFTDRQRRWFFAALRSGEINPGVNNRTHSYKNSWRMQEENSDWRRVDVVNDASNAGFVGGINQARLNAKVGWRKAVNIVQTNIDGAIQAAQRAVDKWIAERN